MTYLFTFVYFFLSYSFYFLCILIGSCNNYFLRYQNFFYLLIKFLILLVTSLDLRVVCL